MNKHIFQYNIFVNNSWQEGLGSDDYQEAEFQLAEVQRKNPESSCIIRSIGLSVIERYHEIVDYLPEEEIAIRVCSFSGDPCVQIKEDDGKWFCAYHEGDELTMIYGDPEEEILETELVGCDECYASSPREEIIEVKVRDITLTFCSELCNVLYLLDCLDEEEQDEVKHSI